MKVQGGQPPDDRCMRAHPCTHAACAALLCLVQEFIVLEFGLVSLGLHRLLQLSPAGLIVVLVLGRCWAYSAFPVKTASITQRGLDRIELCIGKMCIFSD